MVIDATLMDKSYFGGLITMYFHNSTLVGVPQKYDSANFSSHKAGLSRDLITHGMSMEFQESLVLPLFSL